MAELTFYIAFGEILDTGLCIKCILVSADRTPVQPDIVPSGREGNGLDVDSVTLICDRKEPSQVDLNLLVFQHHSY